MDFPHSSDSIMAPYTTLEKLPSPTWLSLERKWLLLYSMHTPWIDRIKQYSLDHSRCIYKYKDNRFWKQLQKEGGLFWTDEAWYIRNSILWWNIHVLCRPMVLLQWKVSLLDQGQWVVWEVASHQTAYYTHASSCSAGQQCRDGQTRSRDSIELELSRRTPGYNIDFNWCSSSKTMIHWLQRNCQWLWAIWEFQLSTT